MKKTTLLFIGLSICISMIAQEKVKRTEIGLVFNNFDNFGLILKKGNNNFLWRFNTMLLSGNKSDYKIDTAIFRTIDKNFGLSVSLGHEFRKQMNEHFEFAFGYDFAYSYSQFKKQVNHNIDKVALSSPAFNLVFGFNCVLKEHLVIGAELLPYFSFFKRTTTTFNDYSYSKVITLNEIHGFNYGLSNASARLLLAYRF